jgi:hypothetical protein
LVTDNQNEPPIARWLTLPGRILLVATVLGCAGGFYWYFMSTFPDFPSGRYPFILWLAPVLVAGCAFFFGAAWVLEKVGIPIYKEPKK